MPRATPPTQADLLNVLRRVTPVEYHRPIEDDPRGSFALYRGMAAMYANLAAGIHRSNQAAFYKNSSLQTEIPATSGVVASATIRITRGTDDISQARVIPAGGMVLEAGQGREYLNRVEVEWIPFDTERERSVLFVAAAAGFVYNLDHIADPDGLITAGIYDAADPNNPNANGPDTAKLGLRELAGSRTSIGGSILGAATVDDFARLQDSGKPDVFRATDVGLYVRIDAATNPDNVGRVFRITGYEEPGIEDPPLSGLFPRQLVVDDGPQRFRLLSAQADDGGVFTDQTVAANEESPDDMTLLPAAPVAGDAYYFGSATPFGTIDLTISQVALATTLAVVVEFFNGATYEAVTGLVDGTLLGGIAFGQSGQITFTVPATWATDTINSVTAFHARVRLVTVVGLTQQPLGQQAFSLNPDPLIAESGAVTWSLLDWIDLGFELVETPAPSGGRDDNLRMLGEERQVFQQTDETDDTFRERASQLIEVVSPQAIRNAINRALDPFGLRGQAFDIQDDGAGEPFFDGFFADVDAADYYEPGDAFPESPYKLPLSDAENPGVINGEARGFFFVRLPFLGFGEFGMSADDGPIIFLEVPGTHLGSAADHGFVDGFPVDGDAVNRAIWDTVNRIRAGGVGFVMIRDAELNAPPCP